MKQNENEIKGKELFELSLTFTEGDEDKQFSVTMKAKKDGKETSLDCSIVTSSKWATMA